MDLLDQVYELLGEEEISRQEFADILEAGFGEITVGTIPQNVDRIVVGDMERTRLKQVKVLFFLGVNDGNIPKNASKGGIISDMDREFLIESGTEMAPSPRQQMYMQRFYLYLNMTKPSEQLYLSYAKVNSEGKGIRPSYLIDTVRKLFPAMCVEYPQNRSRLEQIEGRQEGARYLAEELREYVEGTLPEEERQDFYLMYRAYEADAAGRDLLTRAAFRRYRESGLSRIVARALYGQQLENSVSRLETYAACACRHFLQYGLSPAGTGRIRLRVFGYGYGISCSTGKLCRKTCRIQPDMVGFYGGFLQPKPSKNPWNLCGNLRGDGIIQFCAE